MERPGCVITSPCLWFDTCGGDENLPPPLAPLLTMVRNGLQSFLSQYEVLNKNQCRKARTHRESSKEQFASCILALAESELKSSLLILLALQRHAVNPCKCVRDDPRRNHGLETKCIGEFSPCLTPVINVLLLYGACPPLRELGLSMSALKERLGSVEISLYYEPSSPPYVCCFCPNGHHRNHPSFGSADGWFWTLLMPQCVK
jgi:hypothetical protein